MSKAEIIASIAAEHDLPKAKAQQIYDGIFASIAQQLKKEGRASVSGFGTFVVSKRAARTARNPQTGEPLKIKASNSVRFKAAPSVKETVQKFKVK